MTGGLVVSLEGVTFGCAKCHTYLTCHCPNQCIYKFWTGALADVNLDLRSRSDGWIRSFRIHPPALNTHRLAVRARLLWAAIERATASRRLSASRRCRSSSSSSGSAATLVGPFMYCRRHERGVWVSVCVNLMCERCVCVEILCSKHCNKYLYGALSLLCSSHHSEGPHIRTMCDLTQPACV